MLLSQIKQNETATIIGVDDGCTLKRRLCDMGFVSGQQICCTDIGFCGSPIAYTIRGSKIALRKKDASMIGVVL
ncbi:MAG: FeoA family protein [Eubacteriales bacterium]|nr:FeoA family protein [Eubacteriales bacterium]